MQLATTAAEAVLALALAHRLLDWSVVPPLAWLAPVLLVAAGAAGAVLRAPGLPAWRADRPLGRQRVGGAIHLALVALVVALVLWG